MEWRSTNNTRYGTQVKEMEVGSIGSQNNSEPQYLLLALHWRPTCSFRDPWRTPEKPRRTPLENSQRTSWRNDGEPPGVPPTPIRWRSARSTPPSRNRSRWRTDGIGESVGEKRASLPIQLLSISTVITHRSLPPQQSPLHRLITASHMKVRHSFIICGELFQP